MTFIRRTRNPEVAVVLLEDGAATLGLLVALGGVATAWVTGNPMWDGVATVLIGLLLCAVAVLLTIEMKSLLIGETIPIAAARQLEAAINALDGVERVLNLRTEHLGPDHVLVCVKVAVTAPADLDRVVDVINAVEHLVHSLVPDTLTCYVEPDRYDRSRPRFDRMELTRRVKPGETPWAGWFVGLVSGSVLIGIALGYGLLHAADGLDLMIRSQSAMADLGDLGSPWVFTAFATGALDAASARRPGTRLPATVVGGAAAAVLAEVCVPSSPRSHCRGQQRSSSPISTHPSNDRLNPSLSVRDEALSS